MGPNDGLAGRYGGSFQLQRDAGLMALNLQVLGQYVSLKRMSSEVPHLAFAPEVFPSYTVNVAAPTGAPRGYPDDDHGIVATTGWPGYSWAEHCVFSRTVITMLYICCRPYIGQLLLPLGCMGSLVGG